MGNKQATPVEIKIRKLERGVSDKMIAARVGVTESAICHVWHGRLKSSRIRAAIAEALGWPESRIWADAPGRARKAAAPSVEAEQPVGA